MAEKTFREEVHNQILAQLLVKQGIVSYPETIDKTPLTGRRMPDVLVEYQGLRTIIEGKVNDHPGAMDNVHLDATRRVAEGLAHISIGVLYPPELRKSRSLQFLNEDLEGSLLQIEVISEFGTEGWTQCHVADVGDLLRRTFEQMSRTDLVYQTAARLEAAVEVFARPLVVHEAVIKRFAAILGVGEPPEGSAGRRSERFMQNWREGTIKIGGLTILNAMIFHELLSETEASGNVPPLRGLLGADAPLDELWRSWTRISTEIDYQPIFGISSSLIEALPASPDSVLAVCQLGEHASAVLVNRTSLKHDLMGRVYHTLLADKKYLGTYYTSVSAATLLLKVALAEDGWNNIWADIKSVAGLRIADIACGTGTLLMAAYEALTDNYIHACFKASVDPNLEQLHKMIMENVLYGYDVLPSALHLTASTLALRSSSVTFGKMNLFNLPLGGRAGRLGSIEFLNGDQIWMNVDIFESAEQVTAEGDKATHPVAPLPRLDLCVINPPFTRSVGGNLLFGSSPDKERRMMQDKLAKLLSHKDADGHNVVMASSTAGLGSVFVAIADRHLKTGGKLALVLPKTLLSGVAWEKTRKLLAQKYVVETIIVSHDPERWNFSDNTDLSEVLLVARKISNGGNSGDRVTCVNLWKNPQTVFSSLMTAKQIVEEEAPDIETDQGASYLAIGETDMGEAVSLPWRDLKNKLWILPCAFAQHDLVRTAYYLQQGIFYDPTSKKRPQIPLTALSSLGELGPDRRDIHDGFTEIKHKTRYPAVWNHRFDECITMAQRPNRFLKPREKPIQGRSMRHLADLWPKAGKILISERIGLNHCKVIAVRVSEKVLANVWWPLSLAEESVQYEKALVIWFNSILGIINSLATRCETHGPWIDFKKPNLEAMPVLDVRALSNSQLKILSDVFDEVAGEPLSPFPLMENDPVRAKIDAAVSQALGLPDLKVYRMLLAQEPVVCGKPMY